MCGRVTLTVPTYERLCEQLGVAAHAEDAALYKPRYNVAPTDVHWIVHFAHEDHALDTKEKVLEPARWGLINFWAKDDKRAASQINARAESVATSRAFKEAYAQRRCVVPIDGWYEWYGPPKDRHPMWFHHADRGLIFLAGLYEDWRPAPDQPKRRTFTVLTTDATGIAANVHDRMPVRVPSRAVAGWLDASLAAESLIAGPMDDEEVLATEVSKKVNSVKNDDPSVLDPSAPLPPPKGQGSLF